jgi:hypothetical protein
VIYFEPSFRYPVVKVLFLYLKILTQFPYFVNCCQQRLFINLTSSLSQSTAGNRDYGRSGQL